jgi:replicative DNA helicase
MHGMAEIIIAKHRNGAVGDVKLRFKGEFARFQNPDDEMVRQSSTEGLIGSRMNSGAAMPTAQDAPPAMPPEGMPFPPAGADGLPY